VTIIRPAVKENGGDIWYINFKRKHKYRTILACREQYRISEWQRDIKKGIETMLMHYIPEVTGVFSVEDDTKDDEIRDIVVESSKGSGEGGGYEERLAA